jgi:hypothetical protein
MLDEPRDRVARGLQAIAVRRLHHERVEQDLALRREHARMQGGLRRQELHVVGDHALDELLGVLTLDGDDPAVG